MRQIVTIVFATIVLGWGNVPSPATAGGGIAGTGLSKEDIEKLSPPLNQYTPLHDPVLERRAFEIFPWASQTQERLQWLNEQENIQADRERGNSYSVRIR
jgi:hypothetical protein